MAVAPESDRAVREAQARFRRTLKGWVMDVLELRRRGLHRPALIADAVEEVPSGERLDAGTLEPMSPGAPV